MYLLIVLLPLFSFLTLGFFGRFLGKHGSVFVSILLLLQSALLAIYIFVETTIYQMQTYVTVFPWVNSNLFEITWELYYDSLTAVMLVVVLSVSSLVHIYASAYMATDAHLGRFMSYLSLFTFFMLVLVTAANFIQLFVGWEGVGLCSYLLINFWYLRLSANKAAIKAMLMNRVGDLGLCLGLFIFFLLTGSLDYANLFSSITQFSNSNNAVIVAGCLLVFIGSVGKSAQLGLHTWLPDAMEGPTPVSALIHAATMVTAGVFLILRCSILFELASTALLVVTLTGAITAFFAATAGAFQQDLKKVIAYSTCSQLGYMVFACGISSYHVSIFHLANHAFFKALLFLSAGSIIHAVSNEQDMRRMGGLQQVLPFSYTMILIGSLALMGTPFLTGFYSKDFILESAYATYSINGHFAFWLGSMAALLTAFYSIRLVYLTFLQHSNMYRINTLYIHEAPLRMAIPLCLLAIASIFAGYVTRDMFLGGGTYFWGNTFTISPLSLDLLDAEFIPFGIKLVPLFFSFLGVCSSFILYSLLNSYLYAFTLSSSLRAIYNFFANKWYFDNIYNYAIGLNALAFGGKHTFLQLDKGFIELLGPAGFSKIGLHISKVLSFVHTGMVHHYIFIMMLGVSFLFVLLFTNSMQLSLFVILISICSMYLINIL